MKKRKSPNYVKRSQLIQEAADYILDVREGKIHTIKTGRPWLDDIFPVLNQSVITIGAGSGVGKSYELAKLMNFIMDKEVNPSAGNYTWLNVSLEMKMQSLVLRDLARDMKVNKKDILYNDMTDDQIDHFMKLLDEMEEDERCYIRQKPTTPSQFEDTCRDFLEEHKDKESVFISVDHLALFRGANGENRNVLIEEVMMIINDLKLEYRNVIFVLLSQLNRNRDKRLMDKNIMAQPIPSDLYYSEFTFQISDYVYIIVNPYRDKLTEYSYVIAEAYPHLEEFFLEVDKKGRTALETIGVMYYHNLKCRDADFGDLIDIYAEEYYVRDRELLREQRNKDQKPQASAIFDAELGMVVKKDSKRIDKKPKEKGLFGDLPEVDKAKEVPVNFDLSAAFDPPVQTSTKKKMPF